MKISPNRYELVFQIGTTTKCNLSEKARDELKNKIKEFCVEIAEMYSPNGTGFRKHTYDFKDREMYIQIAPLGFEQK